MITYNVDGVRLRLAGRTMAALNPHFFWDGYGAYGLEQVYNVIDSRYRSRKPLIVTTNLTLDSLQNPLDTAHARIYDRLLEMCAPILFTGENFRRETAQAKLNRLKELMK